MYYQIILWLKYLDWKISYPFLVFSIQEVTVDGQDGFHCRHIPIGSSQMKWSVPSLVSGERKKKKNKLVLHVIGALITLGNPGWTLFHKHQNKWHTFEWEWWLWFLIFQNTHHQVNNTGKCCKYRLLAIVGLSVYFRSLGINKLL